MTRLDLIHRQTEVIMAAWDRREITVEERDAMLSDIVTPRTFWGMISWRLFGL